MKVSVVRKTPVDENEYPATKNQDRKLTNERHTRGRNFGKRRTIVVEILA
jgi:hypothetical protein